MGNRVRALPALLLTALLPGTTPGLSVNLAQGFGNPDRPFGAGGGVGFTLLFREQEATQGRLRLEFLGLAKGPGVSRAYTDWDTYPAPPLGRSYTTAHTGSLFQAAYDWRIRPGGGRTAIILGVGYYQLSARSSAAAETLSTWKRRDLEEEARWQREGITGTFGVGFSLSPAMDLELRYDHYQPKLFAIFDSEGDVSLKPSHLTVALQVRF